MTALHQNSSLLRGKLESQALRLIREGHTLAQARDATDVPLDRIKQLLAETPGARPAAAQQAPRRACDHITELPIAVLHQHPANVRRDLGDLAELEQSLRSQGLLQPIVVVRRDGRYVVLAGHRRLAAASAVGLQRVPVVIRDSRGDLDATEAMLVENLQRAALDPLDEAEAYRALIEGGRTAADVAKAVGKNPGHISQRLALLNLTAHERQLLRDKAITQQEAYRAGRDRSPNRRPDDVKRPKPQRVAHFAKSHPLAAVAQDRCKRAGHPVLGKLGPACGPCWERTIRDDERGDAA